jgi:hypothetical protein
VKSSRKSIGSPLHVRIISENVLRDFTFQCQIASRTGANAKQNMPARKGGGPVLDYTSPRSRSVTRRTFPYDQGLFSFSDSLHSSGDLSNDLLLELKLIQVDS